MHSRVVQAAVIAVFGALPATLLSVYAVLGLVMGVVLLDGEAATGLAMMASSALGLIGTVGLWLSVFRPVTERTAVCLVLGLFGLAGATLFIVMTTRGTNLAPLLLFGGPAAAAIYQLRQRKRSAHHDEGAKQESAGRWSNF